MSEEPHAGDWARILDGTPRGKIGTGLPGFESQKQDTGNRNLRYLNDPNILVHSRTTCREL